MALKLSERGAARVARGGLLGRPDAARCRVAGGASWVGRVRRGVRKLLAVGEIVVVLARVSADKPRSVAESAAGLAAAASDALASSVSTVAFG